MTEQTTYTTETAMAALQDETATMQEIAAATGWPIIDGALVPEPAVWHACDDGGDECPIDDCETAEEAAQEYVDGGEYPCEMSDGVLTTGWVVVRVWHEGLDAEGDWVRVDESTHRITIEPEEPPCTHDDGHDWQAPQEIVGGCDENPGVYGHGGGVTITRVCIRCGCSRTEDTWAQDPADGTQGLRSTSYQPGQYADEVQGLRPDTGAE